MRPSASPSAIRRLFQPLLSLALLVSVVTFSAPLHAQATAPGSIHGRVQNATSGNYLENARVTVAGTNREAFTDASGSYHLNNVPAGSVTLNVFYTGLNPRSYNLEVTSGQALQQNIALTRTGEADASGTQVVALDPFVVSTEREYNAAAIAINEQRFAASKREVVSTDAFGQINQGNIGEFVKHLPGVSFEMKDGNNLSGIMVRGFSSNFTNVTYDGAQVASAALSNTQNHSRQFVLEQANIVNVARIEVVKLPTPDMAANLLGGAVNFISKTAFEVPNRQIRISSYLTANEKEMDLSKSPGPHDEETFKVRPSVTISYLQPVNDKLGFNINAASMSQFYLQNKTTPLRRYTTSGATLTNPQGYSYLTSSSPNLTETNTASGKVDWKPWEGSLITINGEATEFKQRTGSRGVTYNVGNGTPVSWGETSTNGSVGPTGTGTASMSNSYQDRHTLTRIISGKWEYDRENWEAKLGATYSFSSVNDRDLDKGMFRNMSTTLANTRTVNIAGINNEDGSFQSVQTLDAAGNQIDSTKIANYLLTGVSGEPRLAEDEVLDLSGRVAYNFTLPRNIPLKVTLGGSMIETEREIDYLSLNWTYLGPDGIAGSGDESLATYRDANFSGESPGFGRPGYEWASPFLVRKALDEKPNLFTRTATQQGDTIRNNAIRSPNVWERITAGYIMGDTKLFNRLRIVGGVRYELTKNWGYGYKQDNSAVFHRDAAGNLIKVNGAFVRKPEAGVAGGPVDQSLIYKYRGQYNERDYDGFFPSLHTTFEIRDNLQLRVAYAKTIGRPRILDIVPNLSVSDNVAFDPSLGGSPGSISSSNTTLKPYTAQSMDYALEYYLPKSGVISFSYFSKDISDFISSTSQIADAALLDQLGLSQQYVGYTYNTRINAGDAKIQGWEANVVLPLENFKFLGSFASHFTLRGNITHLDLSGARVTPSDWALYTPRSRNGGIAYRFGRFSGNILANYKGRQLRDTSSAFPGALEYIRPRVQVDADINYQVTKNVSVFIAGRNINNGKTRWEVSGPGTPEYAWLTNYEDYGATYSLGVTANF